MLAWIKNTKRLGVKTVILTFVLFIFLAIALAFVFAATNSQYTQTANATDVNTAQNDLASAKAQLATANAEYEAAAAQASAMQAELDAATEKALESQTKMQQEQTALNSIATYEYRNGSSLPLIGMILDSNSFESLIKNIDYANFVMAKKQAAIVASKQAKEEFDEEVDNLNSKYDNYKSALNTAAEKQAAANKIVENASATLSEAEAEQLKAQQQQQQSQPSTPTPTPDPGPGEGGDWKSGEASAYNGSRTATGETITDSSMGVAVSMTWPNYRSLFGHTVQIKLHGKTVLARVNDCGGFGGNRVLDVQPGVCHAYGFANEYAWGVQHVEYRFL